MKSGAYGQTLPDLPSGGCMPFLIVFGIAWVATGSFVMAAGWTLIIGFVLALLLE